MGEIVVISEEEEEGMEEVRMNENCTSLTKLEKLMFLRVLLVESDDSTRTIISALLRKCGYTVVSVPDGLKAWETLKERSRSIDLVLAEVELPSISGFSLLSMIMEDEICRNIPVIMMSSHDAVNVVFKCMLRGAADFLVKPVRKNELRNLWQHVWRRHSLTNGGQSHQNGNPSQQKVEAIDESSSTTHSSDCDACPKNNKECIEKGNDAQSSCTKPDMEADNANLQHKQNLQLNSRTASLIDGMKTSKDGESVKVDDILLMHENEAEDKSARLASEVASGNQAEEKHVGARILNQGKDAVPETQGGDTNFCTDTIDENNKQLEPSREAMDLIGAFDNHLQSYNTYFQKIMSNDTNIYFDPNTSINKCSSTPQLELSLRRCHPSDREIQGSVERHTLKHSNASAFSRYNNRVQPPHATSTSFGTESKDCASVSCKYQSNQVLDHTVEVPQHQVISAALPVRGTDVDGLCSGYGAVWPPLFYTPVGPLPLQSSNSATQKKSVHVTSSKQSNPENHDYLQSNCKSQKETMHEQGQDMESFDDTRHISHATAAQSVTSSFCISAASDSNSSGCGSVCDGSDGNDFPATIVKATSGFVINKGLFTSDAIRGMDSHCSTQREAALTKFRLKRKDRCFEKKVRYQSRKRLAEQRPRVKGQFVRQMPS